MVINLIILIMQWASFICSHVTLITWKKQFDCEHK